jgi:hypothetical protein
VRKVDKKGRCKQQTNIYLIKDLLFCLANDAQGRRHELPSVLQKYKLLREIGDVRQSDLN